MNHCSQCKISMETALLAGVEVDYCPSCLGLWFDEGELELAKDARDNDLRWLDVDLWRDPEKMRVSPGGKLCPVDRMPLYEVRYGESDTKVDVCNICHGIWLDRGEFKAIIAYIREQGEYEILNRYTKDLLEELWEVFSGPEILQDEIYDFLAITKLLRYKFAVHHPTLSMMMLSVPA